MVEPNEISIFSALRTFHTHLYNSCTSLHFHQLHKRDPSFIPTTSPTIVALGVLDGKYFFWNQRDSLCHFECHFSNDHAKFFFIYLWAICFSYTFFHILMNLYVASFVMCLHLNCPFLTKSFWDSFIYLFIYLYIRY